MPSTSMQQGIMMGLAGLTARGLGSIVEKGTQTVTPNGARIPARVAIRASVGLAGAGLAMIPPRPGASMWRSGIRSTGQIVAAVSISGAVYDVGRAGAARTRSEHIMGR
jgi:hypothetical protein